MIPAPSKTPALLSRVAFTCLTVLSAGALIAPATAQENKPDIKASTQIHKISMSGGKETYVVTPVIGLDDVVQYTMDYHNSSEKGLSNVQVTFKIPKDMRYVGGSMTPIPSHAKASGDTEWRKYPFLEFVAGRPQEMSASVYDAFAWTIPRLDPKQTARIVMRTKLVQRPSMQ
jgi:uncharacterized repeat protein (TIGR01451 family)